MGQLIQIIPKTSYDFDGRTSSTQVVVLRDRISTVGFASGVIVVRVHEVSGFTGTASLAVKVYNASESPEDRGTFFVGATNLVGSLPTITDSTTAPTLLIEALTAPIGPMIRVELSFAQGGTPAGGAQTVTLGIDFVGREAS